MDLRTLLSKLEQLEEAGIVPPGAPAGTPTLTPTPASKIGDPADMAARAKNREIARQKAAQLQQLQQ